MLTPEQEAHEFMMDHGLRQMEWDHGGQFQDSNRVVDRHNREIVAAYKKGAEELAIYKQMARDAVRELMNERRASEFELPKEDQVQAESDRRYAQASKEIYANR